MKKRRVVMKDIAEKAGVHQTTVSLALNNDPRISPTTRERIQKLAKTMGYVPDPLLSSLVSYRRTSQVQQHTETIALLFDVGDVRRFEESVYLPSVRDTVVRRASELGYKVEIFIRGSDYNSSRMLDRVLRTRNIHGVLFGDISTEDITYDLDWGEYSLVKITQSPVTLGIDSVMGNYFFSARTVMRKLKEAGFQRPAMAASVSDEHNTRNLYRAGFEFGQRKHYAPENHIPVYEFERKPNEEIEEDIYQWIKQVRPDVLIANWNNLDRPAFRLTKDGHNCRFVCLEADHLTVRYGGIRNNFSVMAQTAVELLISKMKMNVRGIPDTSNLVLVEEKWCDLGEWPPETLPGMDL